MQKLSASVVALCLGFGSTAYAIPVTTRYVQKGASASGSLELDDPDGCIHGTLFLTASEDVSKDATGSTHSRQVFMNFVGSDDCAVLNAGFDSLFFPLTTPIGSQSFTYAFDLNVNFYSPETGDPVTAHRFTGTMTISTTGDLVKSRDANITVTDSERTVVRSKNTTRDADAVVTKAKIDNKKTSFLPGTGSIGETKNATIEITQY
jgi:hypothetical protein